MSRQGRGRDTFCGGWCESCQRPHFMDTWMARPAAHALMDFFDRHGHMDLTGDGRDERFSLAPLFGPARGKMFGVLLCRNSSGTTETLYAFSGQINGCWQAPGWVAPLFDVAAFNRLTAPVEQEIKAMGRELVSLPSESETGQRLRKARKEKSMQLMREIFALYGFVDFHGQLRQLSDAFTRPGNMPTGTGDCCAPKLLAHAAAHRLAPISLAEFYYGRANLSGRKQHKKFYSSCREKCQPLLGAMLCGRERLHG